MSKEKLQRGAIKMTLYSLKIRLILLALCTFFSTSATANQFSTNPLSQAVDNYSFDFLAGTPNVFFKQTTIDNVDCDAAQSDSITDGEIALLATLVSGPTEVSFDWKVSSENIYDGMTFVIFSIDSQGNLTDTGAANTQITGEVDWNRKYFQIPTGPHLAVWAYVKDSSISAGQDAGWVDNVRIGARGATTPDLETCKQNAINSLPSIISWMLDDTPTYEEPPITIEGSPIPAIPSDFEGQFVIQIESETGEYVGQGRSYIYTQENANVDFTSNFDNGISIEIDGATLPQPDESDNWNWDMAAAERRIEVGVYNNADEFPFGEINQLSFNGNGRSCGSLTGKFRVFDVAYDQDNKLTKLIADFEQICSSSPNALRGSVDFDSSRASAVFTPVLVPTGTPFPALPDITTGTAIEIQSDAGDFIGQGLNYSFNDSNSTISVRNQSYSSREVINATIQNNSDYWTLNMTRGSLAIDPLSGNLLSVGVYDNATNFPFNGILPGLDYSGGGSGCNRTTGRFRVFEIEFDNKTLTKLVADFEQRCDNSSGLLRGSIKYIAAP